MHSRYWRSAITILILPLLVCPFLLVLQAGPAYGDLVVDLQLDAPEVIRWDISNIAPGDTGLQPINLHNSGNATGYVYIWIEDLVDGEGENPESETGDTSEPGELSHYISLDIINMGMTFARPSSTTEPYYYTSLPIMLDSFPTSSNTSLYIVNTQIKGGETLELQWRWEFLPTAGNEAQGDTVSFSVYYMLGPYQSVSGRGSGVGVGGGSPPEEETTPPSSETTPVTTENETLEVTPLIAAREFISDDGRCIISIPEGLHVFTDSGEELEYVIIDILSEIPPIPEPFILITPIYRITVYTADGMSEGTKLKQSVMLTILYDTAEIPENAEVYIVSYNPDSGWVRLGASGDPHSGRLTAWVDYLNLVAVFMIVEPTYEFPVEPDIPEPTTTAPLIEKQDTIVIDLGEAPDNLVPLRHASLGVAVSGSVAMAVLAFIQRRRRMSMERSRNIIS